MIILAARGGGVGSMAATRVRSGGIGSCQNTSPLSEDLRARAAETGHRGLGKIGGGRRLPEGMGNTALDILPLRGGVRMVEDSASRIAEQRTDDIGAAELAVAVAAFAVAAAAVSADGGHVPIVDRRRGVAGAW